MVSSSEKATQVQAMAQRYTAQHRCATINVTSIDSGQAERALATGWTDPEAKTGWTPQQQQAQMPDVWSPASSVWLSVLADRQSGLFPASCPGVTETPLVVAMLKPMADALGYPRRQIGWKDIARLASTPNLWANYNHADWGDFKLGRTNPTIATSGILATVGIYYAATGLSNDLSLAHVNDPQVQAQVRQIEQATIYYGADELQFLSNLLDADGRNAAPKLMSAVIVEEKAVWDYNQGNPTGRKDLYDRPGPRRRPTMPLVAIYPTEGSPESDDPYCIRADVDTATRQLAEDFRSFLRARAQQRQFQDAGFRSVDRKPGPRAVQANGLDPGKPTRYLHPPGANVLTAFINAWQPLRKRARVLFIVDVSGSMANVVPNSGERTKLQLVQENLIALSRLFLPEDQVGLWEFAEHVGARYHEELLQLAPLASQGAAWRQAIESMTTDDGTPLYDTVLQGEAAMTSNLDPHFINAIVLLSDGRQEDTSDQTTRDALLRSLGRGQTVRIISIGYGSDQDLDANTLSAIAAATGGAYYDASDPNSIGAVFVRLTADFGTAG